MSSNRALTRIESGVSHFGINVMASFESCGLTQDIVNKSIQLALKKHPYLRTTLFRDQENQLHFVEKSQNDLEKFRVKWIEEKDANEFNDWEKRFNFFSSINYDTSEFIFNVEVYTFGQRFQFYLALNHSGCDTRGTFAILKDLLYLMDCQISGVEPACWLPKAPVDIFNNLQHSYDIEALKLEPIYNCKYHNYIQTLDRHETNATNLDLYPIPYVSRFKQFDQEQSRRLFSNCKKNSTTVQGIISVASMLALINEKTHLNQVEFPVECLNVALIDMRYLFGLDLDDVFKAPSSLSWVQRVESGSENMWDLAASVSKKLKEMKDNNDGLKWWIETMNSIAHPSLNSWASSIGVVSLGEDSLKRIHVNDSRFFLSFPFLSFKPVTENIKNHVNVHAFTFKSRLTVVFGHSFPALSLEWGKTYSSNVFRFIEAYAENEQPFSLRSIANEIER